MKKLILALTALSLAAAFTACRSTEEETVENRLRNEYGWQGGALPPAAPDPQTVIAAPDEPGTAPKDAGIVSTVDIQETVVIDEQPPLPPAGKPEKKAEVKVPSNVKYELTGETKTHVVKKGETLSSIAKAEYRNGFLWGFIFKANKELLKNNPNLIRPGMKITIPMIRKAGPAKPEVPAAVKESTVPVAPVAPAPVGKAPEAPKAEAPAAPVAPAPVGKAPEAPKAN